MILLKQQSKYIKLVGKKFKITEDTSEEAKAYRYYRGITGAHVPTEFVVKSDNPELAKCLEEIKKIDDKFIFEQTNTGIGTSYSTLPNIKL